MHHPKQPQHHSLSRRDLLKLAAGTLLGALHPAARAAASAYPSQPIRLIVPYPPGGGTDILARLVAGKLGEAWKRTVIVENKSGASGTIGNDFVAKAEPDGHTLLMGITALIQRPAMVASMPYDPIKDFAPLTAVARSADLLLVPANSSANTLAEFVAQVKAKPRTYSIGNYGAGTSSHIHAAMLNAQAGLDLNHVPYRGASPLVTDLLGGQLDSAFVDSSSIVAHLGSGKLKVLAVTGERKSPLAPQAPTLASQGFHSFEPYGWFGLFAPGRTPPAITEKLSQAFVAIIKQPDVQNRLNDMGLLPGGNSMGDFTREVRNDREIWTKVITAAGIKTE
ncbi:putattive exported protein [Bordetella ansorpii]|uniref:Putattive exported protein n=1 Tax=Bordetella ansorpii TaxID=288768 RepID=A0A157NPT9_9BORD|nr:tripartite tricarboxylate transporter substrate binding protein [Bordetella ansorpii]SAI23110.1 putattive exported protein [Bordetella ansorpii]